MLLILNEFASHFGSCRLGALNRSLCGFQAALEGAFLAGACAGLNDGVEDWTG
jgi:hypothetical protein